MHVEYHPVRRAVGDGERDVRLGVLGPDGVLEEFGACHLESRIGHHLDVVRARDGDVGTRRVDVRLGADDVVVGEVGVETPREFARDPEGVVPVGDTLGARVREQRDQFVGIEVRLVVRVPSLLDNRSPFSTPRSTSMPAVRNARSTVGRVLVSTT